jgi:hypothetical protein
VASYDYRRKALDNSLRGYNDAMPDAYSTAGGYCEIIAEKALYAGMGGDMVNRHPDRHCKLVHKHNNTPRLWEQPHPTESNLDFRGRRSR